MNLSKQCFSFTIGAVAISYYNFFFDPNVLRDFRKLYRQQVFFPLTFIINSYCPYLRSEKVMCSFCLFPEAIFEFKAELFTEGCKRCVLGN